MQLLSQVNQTLRRVRVLYPLEDAESTKCITNDPQMTPSGAEFISAICMHTSTTALC